MPFKHFINSPIPSIPYNIVFTVSKNDLTSGVLDRLEDTEIFTDETINGHSRGEKIYSLSKIRNILYDEDDDTNETTRHELELLYNKLKDHCNWILIK